MAHPHPLREHGREMRRQGMPLSQIAEACGVTKPCAWQWCRGMPEHAAVTARNTAATLADRRIYPPGTSKFAAKLASLGVPPAERLRLAREVAAADARAAGAEVSLMADTTPALASDRARWDRDRRVG